MIGSDAEIARERHLRSAAEAIAVNRGDGHGVDRREAREHRLTERRLRRRIGFVVDMTNLVHVGPGDEGSRIGFAADDDERAKRRLLLESFQDIVEIGENGFREHVQLLAGHIELEERDAIARIDELPGSGVDESADVDHAHLSTTTAPPCPPPIQRVARPRDSSFLSSSLSSVRTSRAPVAPTG